MTSTRFDAFRVLADIEQLTAIGPRPAGSPGSARQREVVCSHFEAYGADCEEQEFLARDPRLGVMVECRNLVARWRPGETPRRLVAAHADTRPFPDRDPEVELRRAAFVGANDGASGVAVLMEIARALHDLQEVPAVDLVLFDAEELVMSRDPLTPDREVGSYCQGSSHFASHVDARDYAGAVVVDMIATRGLTLRPDPMCLRWAPELVEEIWGIGWRRGHPAFLDEVGTMVIDDHLPLIRAGIPTALLIGFDYPEWHTTNDLPQICSATSLQQVGEVLLEWLMSPISG